MAGQREQPRHHLVSSLPQGTSACLSVWVAQPTGAPSLSRFGQNASEHLLATVLQVNLTHDADFGVFACWVSNATATFTLRREGRGTWGPSSGGDRAGDKERTPRRKVVTEGGHSSPMGITKQALGTRLHVGVQSTIH